MSCVPQKLLDKRAGILIGWNEAASFEPLERFFLGLRDPESARTRQQIARFLPAAACCIMQRAPNERLGKMDRNVMQGFLSLGATLEHTKIIDLLAQRFNCNREQVQVRRIRTCQRSECKCLLLAQNVAARHFRSFRRPGPTWALGSCLHRCCGKLVRGMLQLLAFYICHGDRVIAINYGCVLSSPAVAIDPFSKQRLALKSFCGTAGNVEVLSAGLKVVASSLLSHVMFASPCRIHCSLIFPADCCLPAFWHSCNGLPLHTLHTDASCSAALLHASAILRLPGIFQRTREQCWQEYCCNNLR